MLSGHMSWFTPLKASRLFMIQCTISVPLFVSGYMKAMEAEKPAIRPLMATHLVELKYDAKL